MTIQRGLKDVRNIYESFKPLLIEDIKNKHYDLAKNRVEVMKKEMRLFSSKETIKEFIDEYIGDLGEGA